MAFGSMFLFNLLVFLSLAGEGMVGPDAEGFEDGRVLMTSFKSIGLIPGIDNSLPWNPNIAVPLGFFECLLSLCCE